MTRTVYDSLPTVVDSNTHRCLGSAVRPAMVYCPEEGGGESEASLLNTQSIPPLQLPLALSTEWSSTHDRREFTEDA